MDGEGEMYVIRRVDWRGEKSWDISTLVGR